MAKIETTPAITSMRDGLNRDTGDLSPIITRISFRQVKDLRMNGTQGSLADEKKESGSLCAGSEAAYSIENETTCKISRSRGHTAPVGGNEPRLWDRAHPAFPARQGDLALGIKPRPGARRWRPATRP